LRKAQEQIPGFALVAVADRREVEHHLGADVLMTFGGTSGALRDLVRANRPGLPDQLKTGTKFHDKLAGLNGAQGRRDCCSSL